jgi:hypothetical protein
MSDGIAHGPARTLHAGPLTLAYDGTSIRWVRFGTHEILRGIYGAVRDAHWRTVPATVHDVTIDAHEDSFRIELVADHRHLDVDFRWHGTIVGERSGLLTFTMDGVAQRSFLKNRIGLCVLHPMQACSGQPCTVEHVDGRIASTSFPALVSPHQAFLDVRALAHEVMPGVIADLRVEGDSFETEDQRNWSDTSFKTYSTPVDRPFPVEIAAGDRVRQTARLRLRGAMPMRSDDVRTRARAFVPQPAARDADISDDDAVRIEAGDASWALPRIGLMLDPTQPLSTRECDRLRAIGLSHLRVDLDLADPQWSIVLRNAAMQAEAVGTALQVAALVPGSPDMAPMAPIALTELAALAEAGAALPAPIDAWLLFDRATGTTPASLLTAARELFAGRTTAPLGGGSNVHFADLNRHRPPGALLDLLAYPMSPQAHANDAETMVENLQSVTSVADTARSFVGDIPLALSPVTLKPRFKSGGQTLPPLASLPDHIDVRQMSRFAAGWTVSHLRACAEARVERVTYFRTVGWDGVMERESGPLMPEAFPSRPGMVFPVYHALADTGAFAGGRVRLTRSTDRQRVEALCLERDGARRLLLVNLTAEPQRVHLPPTFADRSMLAQARVVRLHAGTERDATDSPEAFRAQLPLPAAADAGTRYAPGAALPLVLEGHEIVRLDFGTPVR